MKKGVDATMDAKLENGVLTLSLTGQIDSSNAPVIEQEINELRKAYPADAIVLDCDGLEYATSAGLRVILRLKREVANTSLCNVHSELYEILDTTGFTELMEVRKAFRVVSLEGCELIGQGANGKVYRVDRDNVVKVYLNPDSLQEIRHERELARTAFVQGLPTAIPYDVVRIAEGGYGSVFELLNAKSYQQMLKDGEKTIDELADMSISLLKLIHSRTVQPGSLPGIKDTALNWALFLKDYIPVDQFEKLFKLIVAVPEDLHMVHGDYHLKNIMYMNGESLLIDMDTLSYGHPIFELAAMYNAYRGFGAVDHTVTLRFLDIPYDLAGIFWRKCLERYLGTTEESVLQAVEDRAKLIGNARILRRTIRHERDTETGQKLIAHSRAVLAELLPRIDSLLF